MRWFTAIFVGLVAVPLLGAATLSENFATDPLQNGWQIFGDTNLFQWDSTNQNLAVTWDSSHPNSYFYQKLGTILARDDDFSIGFDLKLSDGFSTGSGFELAFGFLNYQNATNTGFIRGTATNSPNVVEWDYFPASSSEATVSAFAISTNSRRFATGGFTFPLELTPGDWFHVEMMFTASNQTMHTVMLQNGAPIGPLNDATLGMNFGDFRADMVSISAYCDTNSHSSILAHGVVSNLVVTVPEPPMQNLSGTFSNNTWSVQFSNRTNWLYTLQRMTRFEGWSNVMTAPGVVGTLTLMDTNPPATNAFYRVSAQRP